MLVQETLKLYALENNETEENNLTWGWVKPANATGQPSHQYISVGSVVYKLGYDGNKPFWTKSERSDEKLTISEISDKHPEAFAKFGRAIGREIHTQGDDKDLRNQPAKLVLSIRKNARLHSSS